jgi:hypothetical protein
MRPELADAFFEYLEVFHNRQRRHSALARLTPVEFETRHRHGKAASFQPTDSGEVRAGHGFRKTEAVQNNHETILSEHAHA